MMERSKRVGMWRGFRQRCPNCGEGRLFAGFLKSAKTCSHCKQTLDQHRADDAPPYFTMTIVGHLVIPGLLIAERVWRPDLWVHAAIWFPTSLFLTWWLMPRVKGAVIGLQWALKMHGFGGNPEET
jgi:uncharacterized protein (DUF983 family)